ncbi:glycerophosphodiester phosphodiesterase family protein [Motilimonas pumila]|uniref:Glycerophosphoryl diester phosphodiesterase n=1 Tax=Motilimonas pumila TaxID=2303987 RepID=A0A418YJ40_9GAMM|nr:glycerophosphodiester phosphodiesterase family protein [Motilimonas pumila]RJG50658.1 glycerophosphoryl diester phosphodiesterase [Motilimonas pumila]
MTTTLQLPRLIGHRGVKHLAPENTLASLSLAAKLGLSWVEIDVCECGTGELVVSHDDTLSRCSNGEGKLLDLSLAQLKQLDFGSWFDPKYQGQRIPTLVEALRYIDSLKLSLNLELKTYDCDPAYIAAQALHAVKVSGFSQQLIISSFCHETLHYLRQFDQKIAIGALFEIIPSGWQGIMEELRAVTLHCNADLIVEDREQDVLEHGYPILCYTVNDLADALKLWRLGVTSIFTDNPIIYN